MDTSINQYKRTRIAPTPSGYLHLGNVLSFAVTAALARKSGARTLLRIDDLDQERANKNYVQAIFNTLNFLKIPWDEGPANIKEFEDSWSQLHRLHVYNDALKQLADNRLVYACTCSRSRLNVVGSCNCFGKKIPLDTENTSWRLITNDTDELSVKNYDGNIIRTVLPADMQNFVVKKKDGFPSYQLASLMDDLFYGVDFIVRGDDLWPSTLAQHSLALALKKSDFLNITFYHHPLLMEQPGKKLSKSAGATSVHYLHENGKNAAGIYTLIAGMLGMNVVIDNWQELTEIINLNIKGSQ